MRETKAVVVSISKVFLVAASFSIYQAHTENKEGHHSDIKCQGLCEKEYKKNCLSGGEYLYLVDEDIVGCICTWIFETKLCEKCMCWE